MARIKRTLHAIATHNHICKSATYLFVMASIVIHGCAKHDARTYRQFEETGDNLDVMVIGSSYFCLIGKRPGEYLYVKSGRIAISDDGLLALATSEGVLPFSNEIPVPSDSELILIEANGDVKVLPKLRDELNLIAVLECIDFGHGWTSNKHPSEPFCATLGPRSTEFGLDSAGRGSIVARGWRAL